MRRSPQRLREGFNIQKWRINFMLGSLKQYEMFIYRGRMYQRLSDPEKLDSRGVVKVGLVAEYSNKMWKFLPPGGTTTMHESYEVETVQTITTMESLCERISKLDNEDVMFLLSYIRDDLGYDVAWNIAYNKHCLK